MSDVLLRPAVIGDVPQIIEACRRGWLSAFAQTVPFELLRHWVERDWYATHCPEHWNRMTVAVRAGQVVGVMEPNADEINGLWLIPSAQRRGIGTRLMDVGETQIRAAGYAIAWVSCAARNEPALAFYRKRGYMVRRRFIDRIEAIGIDEPMFELERRLIAA